MIVYLAQPYSHPEPAIRQHRFETAIAIAKRLMARGISPLSPIAHSHFLDTEPHAPFEVFQEMDEAMLRVSDQMWIFADSGWRESRGVTSERRYAESLGIPIRLINQYGDFIPHDDLLLEAK